MRIVEIAGSLKRRVSQSQERLVGEVVPLLLHQPPRRLGAEVDAEEKWDGGDEGRAQLQPPRDFPDVLSIFVSYLFLGNALSPGGPLCSGVSDRIVKVEICKRGNSP